MYSQCTAKKVDSHLVGSAKKLVLLVSRKSSKADVKSTVKSAARNGEKAKYVAKETETWENDNKHFIEKANKRRKEMDEFMEQQKQSNNSKEFFADFHGTAGDMEEAAKTYAMQEQQRQQQQHQQQMTLQQNGGPQLKEGSNLDNLFNRLGNLYSETQRQKNEQQEKKKNVQNLKRKEIV